MAIRTRKGVIAAAIKATIKTNPVAITALGTALLIQTGCTKAEQTKPDRLKQIAAGGLRTK
jgi:hypothetical protein